MKKLSILLVSCLLLSCGDSYKRAVALQENAIKITDEFGYVYYVVTLEGCEYYRYTDGNRFGLTKVDCNCTPDKTKR